MAGNAEALARVALASMQERLARGPHIALGLGPDPTGEEIRAAFLQLTKQYHPARFGRMANDIQRLSNEVFLALRAAHDQLAKSRTRQSGGFPAARAPSPPPTPTLPQSVPHGHSQQPPQSVTGPLPRVPPSAVRPARMPLTANDSGSHPTARNPTPASGVKVVQGSRPPVAQPRPGSAPHAGSVRQSGGYPVQGLLDLTPVVEMLQRNEFQQARTALHQLAARDPSSKKVKALMCYARGREAQLDRRPDDARVELQDALDLDPDLQLAKTALTELFTRRK